MIRISTNIEDVFNGLEADIQKFINSDKLLRTVALDAVAMISHRVQQQGKKTDGTLISSNKNHIAAHRDFKANKIFSKRKKSTNRVILKTPYSEGYAKERITEGRQIGYIDLTMTGDTLGDFIAEPSGKSEYSVGFRGQKSSDVAGYLEDYFGPIFTPSENEVEFLSEELERGLDAIFK